MKFPLESLSELTESLIASPDQLFSANEELSNSLLDLIEGVYAFGKTHETKPQGASKLPTEGLHEDQIWEIAQISEDNLLKQLEKNVKVIEKRHKKGKINIMEGYPFTPVETSDKEDENMESDNEMKAEFNESDLGSEIEMEDSDMEHEDELEKEDKMSEDKLNGEEDEDAYGSDEDIEEALALKDGFFDFGEMDKFAETLEERGDDYEDPDSEFDSDQGPDDATYEDFFALPDKKYLKEEDKEIFEKMAGKGDKNNNNKRKGVSFEDEEDDYENSDDEEDMDMGEGGENIMDSSSEDEDDEPGLVATSNQLFSDSEDEEIERKLAQQLSSYQRDQQKLSEEIEGIEEEVAKDLRGDKDWVMKGEVTEKNRPENSLLEVDLEYKKTMKSKPLVTSEYTETLEDMIKRRIKEESWDDPERKIVEIASGKEELPEVSMEQSREGLGDLYARDYLKRTMGADGEDELQKKRDEVTGLFKKLCYQLDALSNFHFTPKPHIEELAGVSDLPAIQTEEVLPIAVSEAQTRAPEEVYNKKSGREGVLQNTEEMSSKEKTRARNAKKSIRNKKRKRDAAEHKAKNKNSENFSRKDIDDALDAKNVRKGNQNQSGTKWGSSGAVFQGLQTQKTIGTNNPVKKNLFNSDDKDKKTSAQLKL
eukprot:TRINITY_DN7175_c0_g1_i1.p1 TRINITY_DN7175_c0_g1~~TRINITY_DN7175_c0_g1_i1.p1  ORF type:complete len:651 (-),score=286.91 TRINITY_DN7175_c0_g1_i1:128-2080(-)